jgi:hypothetical protein
MMNPSHPNKNGSQSGMALGIAILVLLVITTVVAVMISMSSTETAISGNFRDAQAAFFASRGGLEEGRDRLRSAATAALTANLTTMGTALPGATSGVIYITNALPGETVTPWNTAAETNPRHYPDDEICKELGCSGAPAGSWYISTTANSAYATTPPLPWKWVRIMTKLNRSDTAGGTLVTSVNGQQDGLRVCWNGTNEVVTGATSCGANAPVYELTALAETASGSRRMVQYEVTKNVNVPVVAAIYAQKGIDTGQALNVTGATDSTCASPSTYGAASGTSTVTTPGGGNVTGTPAGSVNKYGWPPNMIAGLISSLSTGGTDITSVPGASQDSSTPPNINVAKGVLGTPPVVTYSGSDNISAITAPGAPVTYVTQDLTIAGTNPPQYRTLTLGGGSPGISGQGVLIVRGNLTMDFGQNWDYFGLIIVEGNLNMINTGGGNANPHIHGSIVVGGAMAATGTGMGNFNGSISIHQNACMVQNAIGNVFYKVVAQRELIY